MTAVLDIEILELSELDLEGSPPCEAICTPTLDWWKLREYTCKRPSVARVVVFCHACGGKLRLFLCKVCLANFQAGHTTCRMCNARKSYELRGNS